MIYIYTSCALNYIPKARILLNSLRQFAPNTRICLALADDIADKRPELEKDFDKIIALEDIDEINEPSWIFGHTIVELATAIKPFVLKKLLEIEDCEAVFYFDPDIALFSEFERLVNELKNKNILLTPHLTDPENEMRGIEDNELSALKHGIYNLGFIGVSNTREGERFAIWWSDRLKEYCRDDIPAGIFTDQRWIDLVPAFFEGVKVTRYPGYNVAPWNLSNRHIKRNKKNQFTVNCEALVFYHFTGFDSGAHHDMLSVYSKDSPVAVELFNWYKDQLKHIGNDPLSETPWAYNTFDDGEKISQIQRTIYRDRADLKAAFTNPFFVDQSKQQFTYKQWWENTGIYEYNLKNPVLENSVSKTEATFSQKKNNNQRFSKNFFWKFLTHTAYRKNVKITILNTYKMWGLQGLFSLFGRKITERKNKDY